MSIRMSMTATMAFSEHALPYNMLSKNGHGTMMGMTFEKFTRIQPKACGPAYAISCVPFAACTRNTFLARLRFMNAGSI